jgi:hypothetical protein
MKNESNRPKRLVLAKETVASLRTSTGVRTGMMAEGGKFKSLPVAECVSNIIKCDPPESKVGPLCFPKAL